jgi:hypothetical protein
MRNPTIDVYIYIVEFIGKNCKKVGVGGCFLLSFYRRNLENFL